MIALESLKFWLFISQNVECIVFLLTLLLVKTGDILRDAFSNFSISI